MLARIFLLTFGAAAAAHLLKSPLTGVIDIHAHCDPDSSPKIH